MIHIHWEFHVPPTREEEFEPIYRSDGAWEQLFRLDPAYLGTTLLRDSQTSGRYLTIDLWENVEAYQSFKQKFDADYQRLDRQCEKLTDEERFIGVFDEARGS